MSNNRILTVSELAEHLNVHRITIYRLLKNGSLPGFKIGRVWRFDLDEISNWMASGKAARDLASADDAASEGHPDGDGHRDGDSRRKGGDANLAGKRSDSRDGNEAKRSR